MAIGDLAGSPGDVMRRLALIEDELRRMRSARRLEAATIGEGGLTVKGGVVRVQNDGSIIIEDGGDVRVIEGGDVILEGGGDISVGDGGSITVSGGGDVIVEDGGSVIVRDDAGSSLELFDASVRLLKGLAGEQAGIIKARSAAEGRTDVTIAAPYVNGDGSGNTIVIEGWTDESPGGFFAYTRGDATIDAETGIFLLANQQVSVDAGTNLFLKAAQQIQLNADDNEVYLTHTTTSFAANCVLNTTGLVQRSTSARRFKQDIADLDVDPASVLALRPRTWRDKREVDNDPDTTQRVPGFVAEEVAAIPGMDVFVGRDESGEVESIAYDRLAAALVSVVQAQQRKLDALQQRVDAMPQT